MRTATVTVKYLFFKVDIQLAFCISAERAICVNGYCPAAPNVQWQQCGHIPHIVGKNQGNEGDGAIGEHTDNDQQHRIKAAKLDSGKITVKNPMVRGSPDTQS